MFSGNPFDRKRPIRYARAMQTFTNNAWIILGSLLGLMQTNSITAAEKQVTNARHGHILTNCGVWSPDSQWIVYDLRSDPAGDLFDSSKIERIHTKTGEIQVLYESDQGAHCGVATYATGQDRVVFIHGPERPDQSWQYAPYHRRGVIVDADRPGHAINLDARDLAPPFTPGALRGGTHVHTFSGDGKWVAFTYEDHILESTADDTCDLNQRNVGVSVAIRPVSVPQTHPRNHDGSHFTVLVTRTENQPKSGSDQISRAYSNAWIGTDGYLLSDGDRQKRAIAFQGDVRTTAGETITEVFVVDLPCDVTQSDGIHPLQGTSDRRPYPPQGTEQRRLTFTANRKYPGIQGVRHWLHSSPDGSQIAFLMRDDAGVSQLWTISPRGGEPRQVTKNQHDIASSFHWSPDGTSVAFVMDQSVCVTDVASGATNRLTLPLPMAPLRKEACVYSPDGSKIAYLRQVTTEGETWNQIYTVAVPDQAENNQPVDERNAANE